MIRSVIGVALILLLLSPEARAGLFLQLGTRLPERLPFLYHEMQLEVNNETGESVLFPANAFSVAILVQTESGWHRCRPEVQSKPRRVSSVDWLPIRQAAPMRVPFQLGQCSETGDPSEEWPDQPGLHHVKAVLSAFESLGEVPAGGFHGVLESNVLEIRVREVTGVDAEAIVWANGSPLRPSVLDAYPTSEYAAFYVHGIIGRVDRMDPAEVKYMLGKGLYPSATQVPEGGSWRQLSREGVARWRIGWGQQVLREHPDFVFGNEVRLAVALAQMSLGEPKGPTVLKELASAKGFAAEWAKAFLEAEPRPWSPKRPSVTPRR